MYLPPYLMRYVDGFVIVIPTKNLKAYKKMAVEGGDIWTKHGALQYVESVADDMKSIEAMGGLSFLKMANAKKGETVLFSFIVFKNKKHRDSVNKKVMKEMEKTYDEKDAKNMPFDMKRMSYGGFEMMVDL